MSDNQPDRTRLLDMARDFFRGKVLCATVRLGVADALGDEERSVEEVAAATGTEREALYRLLRALASIGAAREVAPARFVLTPFGRPLRRDAPDTVWASMVFWADLLADFWTYLPECVRAGGSTPAQVLMERAGVASRWSREQDATAIFHAVFAEPSAEEMAPFVAAYDFAGCRRIADLGGAGGGLLMAILGAYPQARGLLVDRPEAVPNAVSRLQAAGFAERCEVRAADLLETVPGGADVYIMKYVLHGYDDERARRILENCRRAMTAEGRLLVIEAVLPALIDRPDPRVEEMVMGDINMLAATGGRERSAPEWETLLAAAGFALQQVIAVPESTSSIVEAVPL